MKTQKNYGKSLHGSFPALLKFPPIEYPLFICSQPAPLFERRRSHNPLRLLANSSVNRRYLCPLQKRRHAKLCLFGIINNDLVLVEHDSFKLERFEAVRKTWHEMGDKNLLICKIFFPDNVGIKKSSIM